MINSNLQELLNNKFSFLTEKEKLIISSIYKRLNEQKQQQLITYLKKYISNNKKAVKENILNTMGIKETHSYLISIRSLYKIFPNSTKKFIKQKLLLDKEKRQKLNHINQGIKNNNSKIQLYLQKIKQKENELRKKELQELDNILNELT